MLFRPVMALTFLAFCLAGYPVQAQDQPTDGAMAAFNNVNQQWEDVNKQIESLMTEARTADRSDAAAMNALREKFIGLQKQGKDHVWFWRAFLSQIPGFNGQKVS